MGMYLFSCVMEVLPSSTDAGQQGRQQQGNKQGIAGQQCGMTNMSARLQHGQMQKHGQKAQPAKHSATMMNVSKSESAAAVVRPSRHRCRFATKIFSSIDVVLPWPNFQSEFPPRRRISFRSVSHFRDTFVDEHPYDTSVLFLANKHMLC